MADLILVNGKIHTQDRQTPHATAIAIQGHRILAVGTDGDIRALAGRKTRHWDLRGRLALPGLTDSHFHFYDWALSRRGVALADSASLSDFRERVARAASLTPPGEWIIGRGWNETRWPDRRLPSRLDLDTAAPAHPVILWRSDMHLAVVNSAALLRAGISGETPSPATGVIDRDAAGQPTGVLRDLAVNLVSRRLPAPTEDQTLDAMRDGMTSLHALGLTGVHDFRLMGGEDGPPAFRSWQRLQTTGEVALRVWMNLPGEQLDEAISLGLLTGSGDSYFRLGHIKLFADGSQGARTAWMLEPYEDADRGLPLTDPKDLAEKVERAERAGLAVAVHAIGDRANREVLNLFEQLTRGEGRSSYSRPPAPHRIEHAQILQTEDVGRFGRNGIVASVQPLQLTDDIPMVEASIGSRSTLAYRFRDLLDTGAILALGSDCPVADPNPLLGIHAAVTRRRRDGSPTGGWHPQQRLTVEEALWGYTMGPALASGREGELGSLAPGRLADLVVLDQDILTCDPMAIAGAQVVLTVFDGRIVFEA